MSNTKEYQLKISRLTVDKLGVKLYDKASAVVSELIANSYDADAEKVTVRLPLNSALATKNKDGNVEEKGYTMEVIDDGHGMIPAEARQFYLQVGRDRRDHEEQGGTSRKKNRKVMGRKGIGKLAPFGICRKIEVISAGGDKQNKGYLVSHFIMDYDKIIKDTDEPTPIEKGHLDETFSTKSGTTIKLYDFLPKVVPDKDTFHRQLASRFIFAEPDFEIIVEDTRNPQENPPAVVKAFNVAKQENTEIDLSKYPVKTDNGDTLIVKGWLALAKEHYQNEEMAGVRIYARNKIVATTRDFEQPSGYTGEFTLKSYLVGEVHAEWLDYDDGEDLIRSDRQGIIWDSDYGRALKIWGGERIKQIGKLSQKPRRDKTKDIFLKVSNFQKKATERYKDKHVSDVAITMAEQFGAFANEDELKDQEYVDDLAEVILSVAPHKALIEAFKEFASKVNDGNADMESLLDLFGKTRVAELASYGQIVSERVKSIKELEKIVTGEGYDESDLQELIDRAPWLIDASWSVLTSNQGLNTFKNTFIKFWKKKHGEELDINIKYGSKRPDFTLASINNYLYIVEIKKEGHKLNDKDFDRFFNYVEAFEEFFSANPQFKIEFPRGHKFIITVDGLNLSSKNKMLFEGFINNDLVEKITWNDFLMKAKKAHEKFLEAHDEFEDTSSKMAKNSN